MDQAELTTLFSARPQSFAWFLGAGASATAGLPTATDIIWDLKRRHYAKEENQEITHQDVQIDAVRDRIQQYLQSRGFPEPWTPNEYTTYFEKIFGTDKERQRRYLSAQLSEDKVTLSVGNRVLGALMAAGFARIIFTSNFDTVVEKAVAAVSAKSLAPFHLEGSRSALQAYLNEEFPIYCKLHGDFRHDSIKNLLRDLAAQNTDLSQCFLKASIRFGFIVAGYSGRDESVMTLFRDAFKIPGAFPHGLYWTGMKDAGASPPALGLLADARRAGVNAHFVPIETYDTFMLRLWRHIDSKPPGYDAKVRRTQVANVSIPLPPAGTAAPLLRLNALPLFALPSKCQALTFRRPKSWEDLRKANHNSEGRLIFTKTDKIWCWGSKTLLVAEFSDITCNDPFDLTAQLASLEGNTLLRAFLEEALARALVRGKPLLARIERSGAYLIVDRHARDHTPLEPLRNVTGNPFGDIPGLFTPASEKHPERQQVSWAECAKVSIEVKAQKSWVLLSPNIWIWPRWGRRTAEDLLDRRRGDRFNLKHNALLDAWITILLGTEPVLRMSPFDQGAESENPAFEVARRTGYARRSAA